MFVINFNIFECFSFLKNEVFRILFDFTVVLDFNWMISFHEKKKRPSKIFFFNLKIKNNINLNKY